MSYPLDSIQRGKFQIKQDFFFFVNITVDICGCNTEADSSRKNASYIFTEQKGSNILSDDL